MACPPFEFLWIVKESAYGTTKTSPVAGTDSIYIRLAGANRFTMRPKRVDREVPFGGGFAVAGYTISQQYDIQGGLELELCYSQAKLLLDWCATRINAGQTVPWTTTEESCDLASCSVFHGITRFDGTIKRRKYSGVKVQSWRLSSSADSGINMLSMQLRAKKHDGNLVDSTSDPDATAFPAPTDTAFPTDVVLHTHGDTGFTLGGTALAYCNSLELDVTHTMPFSYAQSAFLKYNKFRGRKSTAKANVEYTATPSWRSDYEALTARSAAWVWTNGVNTITLDYKGNNLVDDVADDLAPGQIFKQNVTWKNQYDTSTNADIAFTYT